MGATQAKPRQAMPQPKVDATPRRWTDFQIFWGLSKCAFEALEDGDMERVAAMRVELHKCFARPGMPSGQGISAHQNTVYPMAFRQAVSDEQRAWAEAVLALIAGSQDVWCMTSVECDDRDLKSAQRSVSLLKVLLRRSAMCLSYKESVFAMVMDDGTSWECFEIKYDPWIGRKNVALGVTVHTGSCAPYARASLYAAEIVIMDDNETLLVWRVESEEREEREEE
jgi:hypothetical protein